MASIEQRWRADMVDQLELRAGAVAVRERAKRFALFAASAVAVLLVTLCVSDVGSGTTASAWAVTSGAIAVVCGLTAFATWVDAVSIERRTRVAALWSDEAGTKVLAVVLYDGPKDASGLPIGDFGFDVARTLYGSTPAVGGHPLLAVGAVAVSGLINGVAFFRRAAGGDKRRARLLADHIAHARGHLAGMLEKYEASPSSRLADDMICHTTMALALLPPAPVTLDKLPSADPR